MAGLSTDRDGGGGGVEGPAGAPRGPLLPWALLVVAALSPSALLAQTSVVQGLIRDGDGAAVYGATVAVLRGEDLLGVGDTDRLGSFRIGGLPPGSLTVRVRALGYAELVETLSLAPDEVRDLELRLEASALELEGLAVEAERARERVRFEEVPGATVRELELEELQRVPGVAEPDPVRAIEVLPGVVSTSDFSAAFHVRGGSQDQNLILLDGMPIFSPFHLGGLFSVFNPDLVERVELQSGGFGAEHGGRVSSVLEIESDPGEGGFDVDGAVSLLATRASVGGRLPSGAAEAIGLSSLRYRFSARRSYFDVLFKRAFEFPYHLTDWQTIVEAWTRGGDRITVTGYTGQDVFDLTTLDDEDFPLRIDWDWGNDAIGARWTHPRPGGGSFDLRANVTRFGTGLTFPDFADTRLDSRISQGQLRADLDVRPGAATAVQLGVSAERSEYRNLFESGGTEFGAGSGTGTLLGAYGQLRWSVPLEWLVELGVRLDGYLPDPGAGVAEISPRVAVKRFLGDGDLAVKLAAGRYTQFVHSLRDEELPLGLDFWVLAGARAPHTVSDQLQIGLEGYRDVDWYGSIEAFVRTFDGVVTFNPADDPNDELDDILGGDGISYGADLLVRKETGDVNGWLAVSLVRAKRTFPDALSPLVPVPEVTYAPVFDRRVDVDFVLRFPGPLGWDGGLRWNVGTGTPYTRAVGAYGYYGPEYVRSGRLSWSGSEPDSPDGDYGVVLENRNGSRYPVYHRLDVSLRRTFRKSWADLTPYLNVVNVYNQRNVLFYFYEYDRTPATRSGISMFPILPTIGLEVRF